MFHVFHTPHAIGDGVLWFLHASGGEAGAQLGDSQSKGMSLGEGRLWHPHPGVSRVSRVSGVSIICISLPIPTVFLLTREESEVCGTLVTA